MHNKWQNGPNHQVAITSMEVAFQIESRVRFADVEHKRPCAMKMVSLEGYQSPSVATTTTAAAQTELPLSYYCCAIEFAKIFLQCTCITLHN